MFNTVEKKLTFSPTPSREGITVSTPSSSIPLTYSGHYSDFMARAFGEINVDPVGSSTPGLGLRDDHSLSWGSLSSDTSRELTPRVQPSTLEICTPVSRREINTTMQTNAANSQTQFDTGRMQFSVESTGIQPINAQQYRYEIRPKTDELLLKPSTMGYNTNALPQHAQTTCIETQSRMPFKVTQTYANSLLSQPSNVQVSINESYPNVQTTNITSQSRVPLSIAQNQCGYSNMVNADQSNIPQNVAFTSAGTPFRMTQTSYTPTCADLPSLQSIQAGNISSLPAIQDQHISSTHANNTTNTGDYVNLLLQKEQLQQQLLEQQLQMQHLFTQQQEQLQQKHEHEKYMHEQLQIIRNQQEQLQCQKQEQEKQVYEQQQIITQQQNKLRYQIEEQQKQMLMEQKQFEQKLQFQLQQQQKHWHEEKQARLIAQIPQYIDPALVCTPNSMSATVFNQEQQLQQSLMYQPNINQLTASKQTTKPCIQTSNCQLNMAAINEHSCQPNQITSVQQQVDQSQMPVTFSSLPSLIPCNNASVLNPSVIKGSQTQPMLQTAKSITVQAPHSIMTAHRGSAPQLLIQPQQAYRPMPSSTQSYIETGQQSTYSVADTGMQHHSNTLPLSTMPCSAGTTNNITHTLVPTQTTSSLQNTNVTTNQDTYNRPHQMTNKKEIQPDSFDGVGKIEWADYIVHFEQCAAWNQWSESQKAQMLSIRLRGEAQKLLSGLTLSQLNDYSILKSILSDRYDPKEKEVTYRCQFRYRRREKGESASDYGYHLRKIAQKAYPNLTIAQLEVHIIDQFINGLGNHELQKHVQFRHPRTLHEAIGLATEYEALEGSIDRIKKPSNEVETVAPIITNKDNQKLSSNVTLEQISQLIDKKLDKLKPNSDQWNINSSMRRGASLSRQNEYKSQDSEEPKSYSNRNVRQHKTFCSYCKRTNHTIDKCWIRQNDEKRQSEQKTDAKSAYAITSQPNVTSSIIPTIIVTAPVVDNINVDPLYKETKNQENNAESPTKINPEQNTKMQVNEKKNVLSVSNLNETFHEEINVNTSVTSCLYLQAKLSSRQSKFLLDTGSPYSILSKQVYEQLEETVICKTDSTRLRAADGSLIETNGKITIPFESNGHCFGQDFIVAKIAGIDGIIGMDFLNEFDGRINIKKQILKTSCGKVTLYKQTTNTCARIQIVDSAIIKPNAETFIKGTIKQPCIRNETLSVAEPTKFLINKGCFIAKTLVNPKDEEVIMSILNLTDQAVKVNQSSIIGSLQKVDHVYYPHDEVVDNSGFGKLPEHLQPLIQNSSDRLNTTEKDKLVVLISQYQDIFMQPGGQLGQTHTVEHEIDTAENKPIKLPPRRVPIFKRQVVDQELDKMLEQRIVEPSDSPWSAPICLVKKKDGSCRFCIDFRKLNTVTLKDAYPLPRIDDTLDSLSGSLWFSTLDLASGYWQIRMSESSKKKTAFVTPHRGLFHFNVMPFGLTNAPASFQRLMEKVLVNLSPHKCLCYLDDIIILGRTFEEALANLRDVFQRLREANLKLKPKKCSLFQTKVTYLGHVVSENGISCDPSKIEAVKNWPTPNSKTEVRSILGLLGYYRKFIPDFAERAKPLTKLTRKRAKFSWDNDCDKSLADLKQCLIQAPILAFPNETGIFILDTDASQYGIGGVLSQMQNDQEVVIAFASKTLNSAQQQYCTTKRELLAVVTFMKHFKHYLLGRNFIIRTDHAPLVWLRNFKEPEGLIARWISIIENYDYELKYRPGRQHRNADGLSRRPKRRCPNSTCQDCYPLNKNKVLGKDNHEESDGKNLVNVTNMNQVHTVLNMSLASSSSPAGHFDKMVATTIDANPTQEPYWSYLSLISPLASVSNEEQLDTNEPNWIPVWSQEELKQMQIEDKSVNFILQSKLTELERPPLDDTVQTDKVAKALWYQWESLQVKNSILYRRWLDLQGNTIYQLVAPDKIRKTIFENLHSHLSAGHLGRDRTLESIKRRFYWPGAREDVKRWIKSCDLCAQAKPGPGLGKSPLQQFRVNEIMQCVAVDIFGPLPVSENGNEYIIVLCEYFSKWVDAWAVPNHKAQTVADKLVVEFFTKFGCPQQIHTDQGREFQSTLFKALCKRLGINQTRTTPYRPNSDGLVERFNRTLKQMLRTFAVENPQNWDDYLPFILMAYRATENKSTGCTPNLIFLQRQLSCPLDLMVGQPPNTIEEVCPVQYIEWVKSAMTVTHEFVFRNLGKAAKRQKFYYDRGLKPRQYQRGDWVWRWYPPLANQKLTLGWTGPFLVLKRLSETTYSIQKAAEKPVINVHVDHMKPYQGEIKPTSWLETPLGEENSSSHQNMEIENEELPLNLDNELSGNSLFEQAEHENTSFTSPDIGTPDKIEMQDNLVRPSQMPTIRSRRERLIKPRQIWSP